MLPAERIIAEHYRLGSSCVILSRSFCNVAQIDAVDEIKKIFSSGVTEIRAFEQRCKDDYDFLQVNKIETAKIISDIVSSKFN